MVMLVSVSQFTLFPGSESTGGGYGGSYSRYESEVVEVVRRGDGAGAAWLGPALGLLACVTLVAIVVVAMKRRSRMGGEPSAEEPRHLGVVVPESEALQPELMVSVDGVQAAWRRVEALVAQKGVPLPASRTTAWTVRQAVRVGVGVPAVQVRALARLHDTARYSGRGVSTATEADAIRLLDLVVEERS